MTSGPIKNVFSSLSSITSSIENDRQVYRWFFMFISLPEIRQKLSLQKKTKKDYQTLHNIQITQWMTCLAVSLITTVTCLMKQPWELLLDLVPLTLLFILFRKNREKVASISKQFLLENIREDALNQQTLYQTSEYLSKQYKIPSLVAIITFQDSIGRKVLLGAILFIPFIYSLHSWQLRTVIISLYFATIAMVNTPFILRKLK